MNGFERFNIRSIAPTMIAQWDQAPATFVLRRLFGVRGKSNPKMWRGDAVEAAVQFYLHYRDKQDAVQANATALAIDTFWQRAEGEVSEEAEAVVAEIPGMVEQAILAVKDKTSRILGSQFVIEHLIEGIDAPFFGKTDFVFEDKSIIELKTTTRCPSSVESATMSHRWQAAIYATARNHPVDLVYVTPKKNATFTIEPNDDCLKLMIASGRSMQKALEACATGTDLLRSLPLNVESFYWYEDNREAYEDALSGRIKCLSGPGTENLSAKGYITFGKHAGKHISEVPPSYCRWLLNPVLGDGGTYDVPSALQDAIRDMREAA